jgi:murein DD-endopeptidase MepM/ murein hydrolase activator NlpD
VQLQIRTPLEPTVMRSGVHAYLLYELHLQNFSTETMNLHGIEVRDAARPAAPPLAVLDEVQLLARLRQATIGEDPPGIARLGAGQGVVAYLCLAFDAKRQVPATLRHRVLLDTGFADGPAIGTRTTPLTVLGRPLTGTGWTPANNPSLESHHRMGLWVVDGRAQISRRYAIDWKKFDDAGAAFHGDPKDVHAYYAYGQQVLAVADGTVAAARDGFPDNVPKTEAGFETAVPITLDSVGGNHVIIDLGHGQFAAYFHLQPGSVQLKPGQRVRRGQPIARIGNSGDARWPHLHFQLSDAPDAMASEGLPFVFEHYRSRSAGAGWEARAREYPMGDAVVDFGPAD